MSGNQTYLEGLSSIPVSATELRQALDHCGEPNIESAGFWGYSMTIGSLHPSSPAKTNAILSRLEALFRTIPDGHRTGWNLPVPEHGVTLKSRPTLGAAATIPLQRPTDQMVFDRDVLLTLASHICLDELPSESDNDSARSTGCCGDVGG
jgi:hypothetical protein